MAQDRRNLVKGNSKIAFGGAEISRPSPYFIQHVALQVLDEFLGEQVAPAAERPVLRVGDVLLLRLVQLATIGDMGEKISAGAKSRMDDSYVSIVGFELRSIYLDRSSPSWWRFTRCPIAYGSALRQAYACAKALRIVSFPVK